MRNDNGYTLLEVLIAAAVVGLLTPVTWIDSLVDRERRSHWP